MTPGICALVALLVVSASCSHAAPQRQAPAVRESKARAAQAQAPSEWFWEPIEVHLRAPSRKQIELPVADTALIRIEGARRVWDALAPDARERLLREGVLVLGSDALSDDQENGERTANPPRRTHEKWGSVGAFYTHLRAQRVPHVVTLDALYALVHRGLERALADVEERELAPALGDLLEKLDARLGAEEAGAKAELAEGYRLARGLIAVARALAAAPEEPKTTAPREGTSSTPPYTPSPDLAAVVAQERGHIEGHAGASTSPLLGVTMDYSRFEVPTAAMRPGLFRALAWLGTAPLTLVARTDVQGAPVNVAQARVNTRAAMILARICGRDVEGSIHSRYMQIRRLLTFMWGPSDDLSLGEIDEIATSAGIDLANVEHIANVTYVDKVRARAQAGRAPQAYDGSGGVGRGGISVRLFGGHAPVDSLVLQSLVGSPVGLAQESATFASIDRVRNGQRVLPSTLDVIAWLGLPEAREALRESHADAFDHYDAALATLQRTRPSDQGSALHSSVHGSLVDSLIAWANAPDMGAARMTPSAERARVESMLAAWTRLRHAGQVLSRAKIAPPAALAELRVSGTPLPVFVEPVPTVIARLTAAVRQIRRGLTALGPLTPASTAMLVELEDILHVALKGAERNASDEELGPEEAAALASLPARFARLEDDSSIDYGPVVAVVYSDPTSRRVLASATGKIEPMLMIARDVDREEPLLVVGAHVAHHEIVLGFDHAPGVLHGVRPALTDGSWRARLKSNAPPRAGWASSFRWTRPGHFDTP